MGMVACSTQEHGEDAPRGRSLDVLGIGSDGSGDGDVNDFTHNHSLHSHQILLYILLLRRCISVMPIGPADKAVKVKSESELGS